MSQEIQWLPPTTSTEPYQLIFNYNRPAIAGNRSSVSIQKTASGEIIRTFEATPDYTIVRAFILGEGKTIAISQAGFISATESDRFQVACFQN